MRSITPLELRSSWGLAPASPFHRERVSCEITGRRTDGIFTNLVVEHFFFAFGKPERSPESLCDCDRDNEPNLEQVLFLANHPDILKKIQDPKTKNRITQIVQQYQEPARQIEELYLWTLARLPSEAELQICLDYMKQSPSPQKALQGILWSLINSSAFLLNY